jgi:hypothetical protein
LPATDDMIPNHVPFVNNFFHFFCIKSFKASKLPFLYRIASPFPVFLFSP